MATVPDSSTITNKNSEIQTEDPMVDTTDKHNLPLRDDAVSSESRQRVSQQSTAENNNENKDQSDSEHETYHDVDEYNPSEDDNIQFDDDDQRVDETQESEQEQEEEEEEDVEKDLEQALQHKANGNNYYKLKQFDEALYEYSMAIKYCPLDTDKEKEQMSIFHGNRAACYLALEEWQQVVDECTSSIEHNEKYIKAYWRRAKSYEKLEKYFDAKQDYNQILEIDPDHEISKANLRRIEPLVQQQFEKQKEEVVDKLKGFANWGLGKIGLSLDNFEATQDPQTGSYNINFKQNPR